MRGAVTRITQDRGRGRASFLISGGRVFYSRVLRVKLQAAVVGMMSSDDLDAGGQAVDIEAAAMLCECICAHKMPEARAAFAAAEGIDALVLVLADEDARKVSPLEFDAESRFGWHGAKLGC